MYVTGGVGATVHGEAFSAGYELPNDLVYAETCASAAMIFFARRMLEAEPKAEYADILEKELYNGLLSGMQLDGRRFFYVNPLEVVPGVSDEVVKSVVRRVAAAEFKRHQCAPAVKLSSCTLGTDWKVPAVAKAL